MKCLSRMRSLVYGSRSNNRALGNRVCIYTYPGGTPSVSKVCVLPLWSGGAGGVPVLSGAGCGGGAPVPLRLQSVCGFCAVPFGQGRQPFLRLSQTIAGRLSAAVCTWFRPGIPTPRFIPPITLAPGVLISSCVSSIQVRANPSLAILAIFNARHMSDWSGCTRTYRLAIIADMVKTYKKLVAAYRVRIGC